MKFPNYSDSFIKMSRVIVPVTALSTIIIPPTDLRTFDNASVFILNLGTDLFNGSIEYSPDNVFPGVDVEDDAFKMMAAGGRMRFGRIPFDAQFFRVIGLFDAIAGDVSVSLFLNRS